MFRKYILAFSVIMFASSAYILDFPVIAQDGYTIALDRIAEARTTNDTSLDLFQLGLTEVPPEIGSLVNVREINLAQNQLTSLPPEIGNLTNLEELNLLNNRLTSLPPEIGNLVNLGDLNLHYSRLTSLPPEIGNLVAMENLNLLENQITELPSEIGNLVNLQYLGIGGSLSSLPPEIGNLTNLQHLSLYSNQLSYLPPEIGNLNNLQSLSLHDNRISNLPPEFGNLISLEILHLSGNQLIAIPTEIGNLSALRYLSLSNNQLNNLPSTIGNLVNLEVLILQDNQLRSLPSEIGNLTNLQRLDVYNNLMTSLPPEIGDITNLCILSISNNQISRLPVELGALELLAEEVECAGGSVSGLFIGENPLTFPPPEIRAQGTAAILDFLASQSSPYNITLQRIQEATNTSVTELDLSGLGLDELPPEIGSLANLVSLDLRDNQLNSLPSSIGDLANLQVLYLNGNRLSSLIPEIGNLSNLQVLWLDSNQLSSIPPEIGNLNNLCSLGLTNNQISQLPVEMGQLSNLEGDADCLGHNRGLFLLGNPLVDPPQEVLFQGTDVILSYLAGEYSPVDTVQSDVTNNVAPTVVPDQTPNVASTLGPLTECYTTPDGEHTFRYPAGWSVGINRFGLLVLHNTEFQDVTDLMFSLDDSDFALESDEIIMTFVGPATNASLAVLVGHERINGMEYYYSEGTMTTGSGQELIELDISIDPSESQMGYAWDITARFPAEDRERLETVVWDIVASLSVNFCNEVNLSTSQETIEIYGSGLTPLQFAQISALTYDLYNVSTNSPEFQQILSELPPGWEFYTSSDTDGIDDPLGFYGVAFKNDDLSSIIVAYRGSANPFALSGEGIKDWLSDNVELWREELPEQFWHSVQTFISQTREEGYELYFTGHSLGGALAEISAVWTRSHAVTFDSPGVGYINDTNNPFYVYTEPDYDPKSDITTYVGAPNAVNTLNQHIGTLILLNPNWSAGEERGVFGCDYQPDEFDYNLSFSIPDGCIADLYFIDHTLRTHSLGGYIIPLLISNNQQHIVIDTERWPQGIRAGIENYFEPLEIDYLRELQAIVGSAELSLCSSIDTELLPVAFVPRQGSFVFDGNNLLSLTDFSDIDLSEHIPTGLVPNIMSTCPVLVVLSRNPVPTDWQLISPRGGIGVQLRYSDEGIVLTPFNPELIANGIINGDILVSVNGVSVGTSESNARNLLQGEIGSEVQIEVQTDTGLRTFNIERVSVGIDFYDVNVTLTDTNVYIIEPLQDLAPGFYCLGNLQSSAGGCFAIEAGEATPQDIQPQNLELYPLNELYHEDVQGASWDNSANNVLTWSSNEVKLWNIADGTNVEMDAIDVYGATISGDAENVLTWSYRSSVNNDEFDAVYLWDIRSGEQLRTLSGSRGATFSPDDSLILSWGQSTVYLTDGRTGDEITSFRTARINNIRWLSNSLYVIDSGDGATIYSVFGRELYSSELGGYVFAVNESGTRAIVNNTIVDLQTSSTLLTLGQFDFGFVGARWNADESMIITWSGYFIRLWDANTGQEVRGLTNNAIWSEYNQILYGVEYDGQLYARAAGFAQNSIPLFDALPDDDSCRSCAEFYEWSSDQSKLLTIGEDDVYIWSFDIPAETPTDDELTGHTLQELYRIDEPGSGEIVVSNNQEYFITRDSGQYDEYNRSLKIYELATGELLNEITVEGNIQRIEFSQDDTHLLTSTEDGWIRGWDTLSGELLYEINGYGGYWNADESLLLGTNVDRSLVLVWDMSTTSTIFDIPIGNSSYSWPAVAWHSNGTQFAAFNWRWDSEVTVYDAISPSDSFTFDTDLLAVSVLWSDTGNYMFVRTSNGMGNHGERAFYFIHDGNSGDLLYSIPSTAMFSPDETKILITHDRFVEIREIGSGTIVHTLIHSETTRDAVWNSDGSQILSWSGEDRSARTWNVETGEMLLRLQHEDRVWDAQWLENEELVFTWTIRSDDDISLFSLWDTASASQLMEFVYPNESVHYIWAWDGDILITWNLEGLIQIWELVPSGDLPNNVTELNTNPLENREEALLHNQQTLIYRDDGAEIWIRSTPNANDANFVSVPSATIATVISEAPMNDGNQLWYQVQTIPDGRSGWVEESALRPLIVYDEGRFLTMCPGAGGLHFEIGQTVTVPYGDGPTNVYSRPNSQPKVGDFFEGELATVLDGPECREGRDGNLLNWYIRTASGVEGWVAEGYPDSIVPWVVPVMPLDSSTSASQNSINQESITNNDTLVEAQYRDESGIHVGIYCQALGYTDARYEIGDAYSWECYTQNSAQSIDFEQACDEVYGSELPFATLADATDHFGWRCSDAQGYIAPPIGDSANTDTNPTVEPVSSDTVCAGSMPTRLTIGFEARQILENDPVRVQDEPGGGTTLFFVYPEGVVEVIGGPQCQNINENPATWWQIRGVNDWTGWVAEGVNGQYFFEPVE